VDRPRSFPLSLRVVALSTLGAALVLACGDDDAATPSAGADAGDGGPLRGDRLPAPLRPDASCPVVIETPELLSSPHVTEGEPLEYNSNPPSSGPHYGFWANFGEYERPVPRGYLVHSLEHGAVLLLYKCEAAASCPEVPAELRKVRDAITTDLRCSEEVRVRIIIAPDPELDVPVAAAAWGWTYKADCVDLPTLTDFAQSRYARGPENTCAPGRDAF
jgi:hypothetical protein